MHRVGGTVLYKSLMYDYVTKMPGAYKAKKDKRSEPEKNGVRLFECFKRLDLTEQMRYKDDENKKVQMAAMRDTSLRCPVPDDFSLNLKVPVPPCARAAHTAHPRHPAPQLAGTQHRGQGRRTARVCSNRLLVQGRD